MNKFVILTHPRTGSNFLASTLDNIKDVSCEQELLHKRNNDLTKIELVDKVATGFKLMYSQLQPWVMKQLLDEDFKIIHLLRKDMLATFYSVKNAERTGIWYKDHETDPSPCKIINDTSEDVASWIDWRIIQEYKTLQVAERFQNFINVTYETLDMLEICEFLNVDYIPDESGCIMPIRQRTVPVCDVMKNYDEIVKHLREHDYIS